MITTPFERFVIVKLFINIPESIGRIQNIDYYFFLML